MLKEPLIKEQERRGAKLDERKLSMNKKKESESESKRKLAYGRARSLEVRKSDESINSKV